MIFESEQMSKEYLSSPNYHILIEAESRNASMDGDSNIQTKHLDVMTTDIECRPYRHHKQKIRKNFKSHRLIEKRRRDRMNSSLSMLLDIIPHQKPQSGRRIEKTKIIEAAVKYIDALKSSTTKSIQPINVDQKFNLKTDIYCTGYHNAIYDTYEYIEKQNYNERFLTELIRASDEKEMELKTLTVVPDRKGSLCFSKPSSDANYDMSGSADHFGTNSDMQTSTDHETRVESSVDKQTNSLPQTKVSTFVLHPSGTHYIPMFIDFSIVSHAFNTEANRFSCHPVSIPVNFDPISVLKDPHGL